MERIVYNDNSLELYIDEINCYLNEGYELELSTFTLDIAHLIKYENGNTKMACLLMNSLEDKKVFFKMLNGDWLSKDWRVKYYIEHQSGYIFFLELERSEK